MNNPIDKAIKDMLNEALAELENVLNSDVLCYFGPIANGNENMMLQIVEELAQNPNKKEQLAILLTTNGGSAMAVERYVNIIRKHYNKVIFIVPDYAYSAGTIFCMSGDEIWMDYFSVLGPIDPKFQIKKGVMFLLWAIWIKSMNLLQKHKQVNLPKPNS